MKIMGNWGVCRLVLAAALSVGLGFGTHASADDYLIDLKTRAATNLRSLNATAINDAGQMTGTYTPTPGHSHAFITGPNGAGMTDLGTLGGNDSWGSAINAAGQVAGGSDTSTGPYYTYHAFMTGSNGVGMIDLGALGGDYSSADAINASGQVAGTFGPGAGAPSTFVTGPNGVGRTVLQDPPSYVAGINDSGQVIGGGGSIGGTNDMPYAFITGPNSAGMNSVDTPDPMMRSWVTGINAAGQVVEYVGDHAFITGPNGVGTTDLGSLGGNASTPHAINDVGQVVGESALAGQPAWSPHAFITGPNGAGMTDLNSLVDLPAGVVLTSAFAINNMGQVIASGSVSIVPEPESYALMLAGLVLMGVMVRRKQKC